MPEHHAIAIDVGTKDGLLASVVRSEGVDLGVHPPLKGARATERMFESDH